MLSFKYELIEYERLGDSMVKIELELTIGLNSRASY
jgi:hypothetical protein